MKDLLVKVEQVGYQRVLRKACLKCGSDLSWEGVALVRTDRPLCCPTCRTEHRVDLSIDETLAKVRLPHNCEAWFEVESSNLAAAGRRGADLVVRFKKGAAYLYPGAGDLLAEMLRSESKGRFFTARVRTLPFRRL
jgi:hypothetical protein